MANQFKAIKTELKDILLFRQLFLQETNFQVRYNACHERGWSDSYLIQKDKVIVGYGSVKGKEELSHRDAIFEFYVMPNYRAKASQIFSELIAASGAMYIECQSNDLLLSSMLYEFAQSIRSEVILFGDDKTTDYTIPDVVFRLKKAGEVVSGIKPEEMGIYILEVHGELVATGGFLLHYNIPFADLYMEVSSAHRRKGFGAYILQEIKKECYRNGRIPAARCNISNQASKATLQKAGLNVVGYMLLGKVKNK